MVSMPVEDGFFVTSKFGPRAGGFHWGTDFGRGGGSGGYPVFAVKSGTVTRAGAASGFGQWVTIDHPASNGGGETVYGHVIPEVSVGQSVSEGQRIARINPDSRANGGVAPHLHMEWHRYSWSPPGPERLDPETMLLVPEEKKVEDSTTIFGLDVSDHQDGLPLSAAKSAGCDFVILRLCDGTYVDRAFKSHLADAESQGLLVSTYWYLRAPSEGTTISQQVDVIDWQLEGRKDLGVWIDVESISSSGEKLLTAGDVWEAKRELERRGYRVPGIYSGAWYWESMPGGEPSMQGLGALWVSSYGRNLHGNPRDVYAAEGGDQHSGWRYPLGDRRPDILQFGSNGSVAGFTVDINAFRGSRDRLEAIFSGEPSPKHRKEESVTFKQFTDFIKGFFGPQIDALQEVWRQLRGPEGNGWPQLGQNAQGQNLTLVDAVAAIRQEMAGLDRKVEVLLKEKK